MQHYLIKLDPTFPDLMSKRGKAVEATSEITLTRRNMQEAPVHRVNRKPKRATLTLLFFSKEQEVEERQWRNLFSDSEVTQLAI
jgi:hypothetical protein